MLFSKPHFFSPIREQYLGVSTFSPSYSCAQIQSSKVYAVMTPWLIFLHGLVWVFYIGSWVVFPDLLWLDATLLCVFETQLLLSVRSVLFCLYTGNVFALSDLALYQQVPLIATTDSTFDTIYVQVLSYIMFHICIVLYFFYNFKFLVKFFISKRHYFIKDVTITSTWKELCGK